jgi:hypothetical protein
VKKKHIFTGLKILSLGVFHANFGGGIKSQFGLINTEINTVQTTSKVLKN